MRSAPKVRMGRLHLLRPPVENLIASKLIRAEPKDLGDIRFLVSRDRLPAADRLNVRGRPCRGSGEPLSFSHE